MTVFIFPPLADYHGANAYYSWIDDRFTDDELNKIALIGDSLPLTEGVTASDALNPSVYSTDHSIRKNLNSWIPLQDNTFFIYDKLCAAVSSLNAQFFQFDIHGFMDRLQYTVYDDSESHYDWHIDKLPYSTVPPRKLTAVLMLSNNDDYEGGDLQILTSNEPTTLEKKKGRVYVFPTYTLHRVTPVTKGKRLTLVGWACGNKFK